MGGCGSKKEAIIKTYESKKSDERDNKTQRATPQAKLDAQQQCTNPVRAFHEFNQIDQNNASAGSSMMCSLDKALSHRFDKFQISDQQISKLLESVYLDQNSKENKQQLQTNQGTSENIEETERMQYVNYQELTIKSFGLQRRNESSQIQNLSSI